MYEPVQRKGLIFTGSYGTAVATDAKLENQGP